MRYTTANAIALRLRGRLQVNTPGGAFLPSVVEPDLIEQVGAQVEARMDSRLSVKYTLPIPLSDPNTAGILASVAEKLIICELMGTHYVGAEGTGQDGYGRMMCAQGESELSLILSGAVKLAGAIAVPVISQQSYSLIGVRSADPALSWDSTGCVPCAVQQTVFFPCPVPTPTPAPTPDPTPSPAPSQQGDYLPSGEAAIAISALRVLAHGDSGFIYADNAILSHAYHIAGLATSSASAGGSIAPLKEGAVTDYSWNWDSDRPIFLGGNGALTQETPSEGFLLQVATVISPTKIYFEIQEPIFL